MWFRDLGWGVFVHFLGKPGMDGDEWNARVDAFDVDGLARQLEGVGASYLFMTVGQCSGHFCAPNETYDRLTGITPSKCSKRDLIADLFEALAPRGIALLTYVGTAGPALDDEAAQALACLPHWSRVPDFDYPPNTDSSWAQYRHPEFFGKWEHVLREWSMRWGTKTKGWWVDGAYGKDFRFPEDQRPNLATFKAALQAGNPGAIVAFNPGLENRVIGYTRHNDYTAGEFACWLPEFTGPTVSAEGREMQTHVLIYQGETWGGPEPRFPDELVVGYTKHVLDKGGVMTWDVGIEPTGVITQANLRQLAKLKDMPSSISSGLSRGC